MAITAKPITASLITANRITANPISAGGAICRNVSNFNGVDSYAEFGSSFQLDSEFEFEFVFASDDDRGNKVIFGDNNVLNYFINASNTKFAFWISNTQYSFDFGVLTPFDSEQHVLRFSYVAGFLSCYLDDNLLNTISATIFTGSFNPKLCSSNVITNQNFKADMYSFKLWIDGDRTTGNLLIDLPLDESINQQTGNVDYINRTGNTSYNATGYNINVREVCDVEWNGEYHVFMLAGQSNMVGRPAYDNLGDYTANVYELNQSDELIQASSPLDNLDEGATSMGMSIAFCDEYLKANPSVRIILVPCAQGGSSFSGGDWGIGNTLYDLMKSRTTTVMQTGGAILKGLLWHQGENDAGNASYESDLDAQMNDYKAFCSSYIADMPIILGEMFQGYVDSDPSRQVIQDIINDTPARITRSLVASSNDLTSFDNLHFDSASLRTLGERYYEQYNNVITNAYEFIDGELYIDGQKWID